MAHFCHLCGSSNLRTFARQAGYSVGRQDSILVECRKCGLIFLDETVAETDLKKFYEQKKRYFVDTEAFSAHYNWLFSILSMFVSPHGSLLDIGCGEGEFLEICRQHGFSCEGIEGASQSVSRCVTRQLNVRRSWFPDPAISDATFDVVTANDVLEHASSPLEFFVEAKRILRPGGKIFLSTPNADCFSFRITKAHHRHAIPPEHLTYWGRNAITYVAHTLDMQLLSVKDYGGEHQAKELLAYLVKAKFLRKATSPHLILTTLSALGHGKSLLQRIVANVCSLADPAFGSLGGNTLIAILQK